MNKYRQQFHRLSEPVLPAQLHGTIMAQVKRMDRLRRLRQWLTVSGLAWSASLVYLIAILGQSGLYSLAQYVFQNGELSFDYIQAAVLAVLVFIPFWPTLIAFLLMIAVGALLIAQTKFQPVKQLAVI